MQQVDLDGHLMIMAGTEIQRLNCRAVRAFVQPEDLTALVRDVFGADRRLSTLDRLTGGTKKGVYRLALDDGGSAVLYVWHPDENYWPEVDDDGEFGDPYGLAAFEAVRACYEAAGVRTVEQYLA